MTFWTDDNVAALERRWNDGDSASVIADALGTTRNAVIGKVDRLGLSYRDTTRVQPRKPRCKTPREPRPRSIARYSPVTRTIRVHEVLFVKPVKIELTKSQLREILRQAVINTAAMQ